MSKLLSGVLQRVSEANNEYRFELRTLKSFIDEKTTSLVGDVVTLSNYTADFSSTISSAKDKLVEPISRSIESYIIKDLRSVETVNEQFVDKINDKIDGANLNEESEKEKFIQNLDNLLNEKYLEIVKIKRGDFLNENGANTEIEKIIDDFIEYLKLGGNYDQSQLLSVFVVYKSDIYKAISKMLTKLNDIYLSNFVNEINMALNGTDSEGNYNGLEQEEFKPFVPDSRSYDEIKPMPAFDLPEVPEIPEVPNISIPEVPAVPEVPKMDAADDKAAEPMKLEPIAPIEIKEQKDGHETVKKPYDVEEILKIAKSPVVMVPPTNEPKNNDNGGYVNLEPLTINEDNEPLDDDFNEREIVEEMIKRLTARLKAIDERQARYEEDKQKLVSDEAFVNDLIKSSSEKKEELDKFEAELDDKEKELKEKKKELDRKINTVMPFATAVLNTEKEETN